MSAANPLQLTQEVPALRRMNATSEPLARLAWWSFTFIVLGNALAAYTIYSIPIPWLAESCSVLIALILFANSRRIVVPGLRLWWILIAWGGLLTLVFGMGVEVRPRMPNLATTSYHAFIALRLLGLTATAAQIYLVWWLQDVFGVAVVVRRIVTLATLLAAIALYIYVAQRSGLPEPPRSRMGTSGGIQAVEFTYTFHRALGTFREPAEMASWLVVPFFLSFLCTTRWAQREILLIGGVILLSGSLAAVVGIVAGAAIAMVLIRPFQQVKLSHAAGGLIALVGAGLLFTVVVSANDGGTTNLWRVVQNRLEPILIDGLQESNRGYLFDYYIAHPFPIIGTGFGNANLTLSEFMQSDVPVSFLSLYTFTIYSCGIVGAVVLAIFLLRPLVVLCGSEVPRNRRLKSFFILSGYAAWLVMFIGRSEEPPLPFAVVYSLLAYSGCRRTWPRPQKGVPPP